MDKEFTEMIIETLNQNIITIEHNLKTMKSMINSLCKKLAENKTSGKDKKK